MDTGDLATSFAAIATAASAVIIACQTIQTRKSAQAANRAADASEKALVVANKSLAISQKQTDLGHFTALEAMRARLDDLSPSVWAGLTSEDPLGYVIGDSSAEPRYEPIELGSALLVPQQEERFLYAVYQIKIINNGPGPVLLGWSSLFRTFKAGWLDGRLEKLHVGAGETLFTHIAVGTRIKNWVYGAENDRNGYEICGEGGWGTALETQKGVVLTQRIRIRGSIIYPKGPGEWELKGLGTDVNYKSYLDVRKIERTYYISEEQPLPDKDPQSM